MKNLKRLMAVILCLVMLVGTLAGCADNGGNDISQTGNTDTPKYGGVMNLVYGTKEDHMDINAPGASAGTMQWARYVYESALATGADGKLYPLVCEYEMAEDYSWFKLWVREGVTFHDGTEVTIEDVIASYARNTKRDLKAHVVSEDVTDGVWTQYFDDAGCVETIYWYGYYDASYGVMPKWICEKFDVSEGNIILDAEYVIGTGCYKIIPDEYVNQEIVPLERYEGYCAYTGTTDDNGNAAARHAYLDRINIIMNTDGNNTLMHFLNSEYDVIFVSIDTFESSLEPLGYKMYADETGHTLSDTANLIFNLHENSPSIVKDDVYLRKAILAAIDMEEVAYAEYSSWYLSQHTPVAIDGYDYTIFQEADFCGEDNIELAKEYLAKSNYNGETLVIRRPSTAGAAMVLAIAQNLEDAGIHVEIEPIEVAAYVTNYRDGQSGWDMYVLFGQTTVNTIQNMPVNNYVCWTSNEEATALREKMFSYMTGTEESIELWNQYAELLVEEVPVWWLCRSKGDRAVQQPTLHPNYIGYQNYRNAYWEDPENHGGISEFAAQKNAELGLN